MARPCKYNFEDCAAMTRSGCHRLRMAGPPSHYVKFTPFERRAVSKERIAQLKADYPAFWEKPHLKGGKP
jgi:hypothetical protein